MEGFSYAEPERVAKLIKGKVEGWRMDLLEETLVNLSVKLSAWLPGLRAQWEESAPDSEIRELARVMVSEAARKSVTNPEGVSSETMGPYAYSKFDSEDTAKSLFPAQDLKALGDLLNAEKQKNRGSFTMGLALKPVAPSPHPGWYTNRTVRGRRF